MKIVKQRGVRLVWPPADAVAVLGLSLLAAASLVYTVDWWWPLWTTLTVVAWVFVETATRPWRQARRYRRDLERWRGAVR